MEKNKLKKQRRKIKKNNENELKLKKEKFDVKKCLKLKQEKQWKEKN